jgi:predicted nucleotidyltransferase
MARTPGGDLPDELLEAIRALARSDPDVECVYLFGSRAKGIGQSNSDLDIAIQTAGATDSERLAAYMFLERKSDWEALGLPFGLEVDLDHYEPSSGGIVAPAVEDHGIELFRRY